MNQNEQMEFFYEIFDPSLPRLGPGDDSSTRKALNMLFPIRPQRKTAPDSTKLRIIDIGCGNGAQTIQLARHAEGTITAVDNHKLFLDELQRRSEAEGLSEKIQVKLKDMSSLEPEEGLFDLIWSEGALYIMGFREGLILCHSLLETNGMLAVTELTWLRTDPPDECRQYLTNEYPAISDIDTNLAVIRRCGYEVLAHFNLPESAWWVSYYHPLEDRLQSFRKKYWLDPERMEIIDSIHVEIEQYRKHSDYYGYVFYLMQRC